jgi:glycosyltransferase involved in cell wall biosynthesis
MLEREHIRVSSGSRSRRVREGVPLRSEKSPALLLCLSHLRWDFVWQRPQHLLSRAASDFRVIVFEEPVFKPGATPHLDVSERANGVTVAFPVLRSGMSAAEIEAQQRRLLDGLLAAERPQELVLWYYTPMAIAFSGHVEPDFCVYDNMDELSAFAGASPEMIANEVELLSRADVVFTGGLSLYEAKRDRHPRVRAFPSSIEATHFAAARRANGAEPADQARIPHPRIGFFGVIDERMDLELVDTVARLRPDWNLVMIGPAVKIDEAALPRRDNVYWLGSKAYAELPSYLAGWDVGFMPFALNESTRFISPTKTPEFLAAGVPVVSTAIKDVIRPYGEKGLVEIASSAADAVAKIEFLLARPRQAWLARVDRQLATGSWDKTWSDMRRVILDGLGRPSGRDLARSPVAIAAE